MKRISLSELLSGVVVAGVAVTLASCGGGGGGNGVSQSGFYQFSIQGAPTNVVYSINPSNLSIPADTWQIQAIFNSLSGASATSAIITSASLCVQEPDLSVSCMPISFTTPVIASGNMISTTAQFSFYKLGQYALEANPYQDLQISQISSTVPAFIAPSSANVTSYSSGSATPSYEPTFYLSNSLVPGTVDVSFSYNMPATVIVSSTTLSSSSGSSSTVTSSSSVSSSSQGTYNLTGVCADNGNGGFNTVSYDTGIKCSGSIQYSNGYVSSFSISQNQSATISITAVTVNSGTSSTTTSGGSSSSNNSTTVVTVTTYIIQAGSSSSVTPTLNATYLYSSASSISANTSSSIVYAYIPSTTTYSATTGLYISTSIIPEGVLVAVSSSSSSSPEGSTPLPGGGSGTSSSSSTTTTPTIYYPCSQIGCSVNNGIFSATLPVTVSASDTVYLEAQYDTFYTYNPNVFITSHVSMVELPYTINATINVNGATMNATYSGNMAILSP